MKQIYLDNNATTKIDPLVLEKMYRCYKSEHVNAASQHTGGRSARRIIEQARETIASLLDARVTSHKTDLVIFTSGGTEANNLAIFGLAGQKPGRVIISAIEHPSVLASAKQLCRLGFDVQTIRVTRDGICDLEHLKTLLTHNTSLVSLMFANNETGVIQPVNEAVQICSENNIPFHCDAVQAIGKIPVSFQEQNFSAMTITPHKLHGPRGIGALLLRHDTPIQPTMFGGSQQYALRPGTEPVSLIVGMAEALKLAITNRQRPEKMKKMRDFLETKLLDAISDCYILGSQTNRLPHTSNIAFSNIDRQAFLMAMDMAGIAISTGAACASGSSEPSHVLIAMNCTSDQINSSIRISLGADTTLEDVKEAIGHIIRIVKDLRHNK